MLDAFVDRGGRAIDTADVYSEWVPGNAGGESEALLGRWLTARKNRDRVLVGTKVAKWSAQPGLAPKNLRAALEGSLRRLGTDHVDVYYAHEDDPSVPQLEVAQAFDAFVREGKVRVLGASNFTPSRLASALRIARDAGLATYAVSQDQWSLVERGVEHELVPLLAKEGLVELPFWALAKGFLTGKYRPGKEVVSARAEAASAYLAQRSNVLLLEKLDALAEAHGVSVTAIALAWLRAQPVVGAPLASARTVEQLDALFEVATLGADEVAALSAVTSPTLPPPAGT